VGRRRSRRDERGERDVRRRGRERGATEGERETERDRRGMDDGSPGLIEKWEREGENEWEGGNETTRVFAVHLEIQIFLFFGG
jgi:hypothetical protein